MDSWPLKLSQGHQNLINSEPLPNNALVQVWSKSIHLFRRYRVGKPNLISFHGLVTLKMRSRSPKSNQLFLPSQLCIYASLVKIHPVVQKISRRKEATRTPTPTGSVPKTICSPPSVDIIELNVHNILTYDEFHKTLLVPLAENGHSILIKCSFAAD